MVNGSMGLLVMFSKSELVFFPEKSFLHFPLSNINNLIRFATLHIHFCTKDPHAKRFDDDAMSFDDDAKGFDDAAMEFGDDRSNRAQNFP